MADNEQIDQVGDSFQRLTKYDRESVRLRSPVWEDQAAAYKTYPDAEVLKLPDPVLVGGRPLWETLAARRTYREFEGAPVDLAAVSQLLWASQGITGRFYDFELRSAPSAGALYPVETYVVFNAVEGQERGLYHYRVREHALELLEPGDLRERLTQAGMMQPVLNDCAVAFLWTAMIRRSRWKYRQRAWRYVYLDAGHIAENLALAAEALDFGCCLVGAFFDDAVNEMLGVNEEDETILYLSAVGPR